MGFDGVTQFYPVMPRHVAAYFLAKLASASENLLALDFIVEVDFLVVNEPVLESRKRMRSEALVDGRDSTSRMLRNWPVFEDRAIASNRNPSFEDRPTTTVNVPWRSAFFLPMPP